MFRLILRCTVRSPSDSPRREARRGYAVGEEVRSSSPSSSRWLHFGLRCSEHSASTIYPDPVDRLLTLGTRSLAGFLCMVLICLAIFSRHCEACEGVLLAAATSKSSLQHSTPTAPDSCNGICSCCALQALPVRAPASQLWRTAAARSVIDPQDHSFSEQAPPFRPPRIALS